MADAGRVAGPALPTGTLTFLFSDIEGSTRLVQALGTAFPAILERHQALLRGAFADAGGVEVDVLREPLGEMATPFQTLRLPDPATEARAGLGDEAFEHAYAAGRAMSVDEVDALLAAGR